jgi:hypothetical protein
MRLVASSVIWRFEHRERNPLDFLNPVRWHAASHSPDTEMSNGAVQGGYGSLVPRN